VTRKECVNLVRFLNEEIKPEITCTKTLDKLVSLIQLLNRALIYENYKMQCRDMTNSKAMLTHPVQFMFMVPLKMNSVEPQAVPHFIYEVFFKSFQADLMNSMNIGFELKDKQNKQFLVTMLQMLSEHVVKVIIDTKQRASSTNAQN
jgi:hypothetical protein